MHYQRNTARFFQELVFVDEELQGERLLGSGAPGSYGLFDDLFAGKSFDRASFRAMCARPPPTTSSSLRGSQTLVFRSEKCQMQK